MSKLGRAISRTIFWSYDRGSWPYDLMVVIILLFVLLTPRKWFHDQPQPTRPAGNLIQLVTEDAASGDRTFRVDASVLPEEKRDAKSTPELERATHDVLSRDVNSLRGQTFQVQRIDPNVAPDGAVSYYDVTIRPASLH